MNTDALLAFGGIWAVLTVAMSLRWVLQRRTDDAGIEGVAWTFGTSATSVVFALLRDARTRDG